MVKEAPAVSTNTWNGGGRGTLRHLAAYLHGSLDAPWYCNNSATDYVYDDFFTYLNNVCDFNAVMGEIYKEGGTSTSFVTYYQDTALDDGGTDVNAFVPRINGANVHTTIKSNDGTQERTLEKGQVVAIQLQELLSMAGVDLNEHHPNSGGEEPTGNLKWPLWRMTGVSIMLEMDYKNFREEAPFDFSKELVISVSAVENVWTSRGQQICVRREKGDITLFERYTQVISVDFRPSGKLGKPNAFAATMNIGVGIAIFRVAKVIVDAIGTWIVKEFYSRKMFTNRDWRTSKETAVAIEKLHKRKRIKPQNPDKTGEERAERKRKVSMTKSVGDVKQ